MVRSPCPGKSLLEKLSADLFPIRSIDVDERPMLRRVVIALYLNPQAAFFQKLFQPSLGDQRQFPSLMHFACDPISGVSMPDWNGTPPPNNRMRCPSQRTVSPSTAIRLPHIKIAAIIAGQIRAPASRDSSMAGAPGNTRA
jgi:hypothetical protein